MPRSPRRVPSEIERAAHGRAETAGQPNGVPAPHVRPGFARVEDSLRLILAVFS